jgi:hypothetical protein
VRRRLVCQHRQKERKRERERERERARARARERERERERRKMRIDTGYITLRIRVTLRYGLHYDTGYITIRVTSRYGLHYASLSATSTVFLRACKTTVQDYRRCARLPPCKRTAAASMRMHKGNAFLRSCAACRLPGHKHFWTPSRAHMRID